MKNKILICIPSRSRAEELKRDTFSFVKHSKFPFKIFVEPQQFEYYKQHIPEEHLVILDKNDGGLCYAKLFIQKYLKKNGIKYCFKLDDDMNNIRLPEMRGIKSKGGSVPKVSRDYRVKEVFDPMIENSIELLDEEFKIGAVSILYGNELRNYDPDKIFISLNNRLQSTYIIRTESLFPHKDHIHLGCFEDFDTYLSLIVEGLTTSRYGLTGIDFRPVGKNDGGLQDFNRRKGALIAKSIMSKRYPFLVWKKVKNKNWDFEPDMRKTKETKAVKL